MRKVHIFLLVSGLLSLVVLALPEIGLLAALTFIGLPVALAYWAVPAVFLISLIAYLLFRVLPVRGKTGAFVSLIAALMVLAVPPFFLNAPIHQKAAAFVAGDLERLRKPVTARSIASRERFRFGRGVTRCNGFCLHALLTGTAERFLIANTRDPHGALSLEDEAIEFRLERRDTCPPVSYRSGAYRLKFRASSGDGERTADPVETLKLRMADGECLVSRPARLADADIVISRGPLSRSRYPRRNTGFSLTSDTVAANRISVHRMAENGFEEIYRRTQVRYRPFEWLMIPTPISGHELRVDFGWWRTESRINIKGRYDNPYAWTEFLTARLGFGLKLRGEETKTKALAKLQTLLDGDTPPTAADWALFAQYFDRIGIGRNTRMGADDFALGLRMLANTDYPAPPRLYNFVRYAARHTDDATMAQLADAFLTRLSGDVGRYRPLGAESGNQIRDLSLAVRALPADALRPHLDAMIALASRPDIQRHGHVALQRLAVFGDEAVPTLFDLMRAGLSGGENFFRDNRYQHPYLAGLQGLCLAGRDAPSALAGLRRLAADGELPDHGSYGRLLFMTMLRLGEDADTVREHYMAAARNRSGDLEKRFAFLVRRAARTKPACHY